MGRFPTPENIDMLPGIWEMLIFKYLQESNFACDASGMS